MGLKSADREGICFVGFHVPGLAMKLGADGCPIVLLCAWLSRPTGLSFGTRSQSGRSPRPHQAEVHVRLGTYSQEGKGEEPPSGK